MEIYTPEEVAEILKVTPSTIRRLCREKKIHHFRIGALYRITDENLKKYLDDNIG